MNRHNDPYRAIIAVTALLLGCCIYLYARPASLFYVSGDVSLPLIGQLPSFLHTLAFALAGSLCADRYKSGAILSWGAMEVMAELAQHDMFPVPPILVAYQNASTFDPLDLLSILAATAIALWVANPNFAKRHYSYENV